MSRRLLTIKHRPRRYDRPKPVLIVEPDLGQQWRIFGTLPAFNAVRARMKKLGLPGTPVKALLLRTSKQTQKPYWLRVYAVALSAEQIRVFARRGRGVYSPSWFVAGIMGRMKQVLDV